MTPSPAPVLIAGGGPAGLVAALALLQNNVPVRIVDKEPQYRIGQKSNGIWHRTFEVFHFLRAHDIHQRASGLVPVCEYKPGSLEPDKIFWMTTPKDPTPLIPYNSAKNLGQPVLEGILRSHLEKYGCQVELGTELRSFEDNGERVLTQLIKRDNGNEILETFEASYIIGADGAKGITRKKLGLSFLGETRQDASAAVGDICLENEWLDRKHWHIFGDRSTNLLMLRPTDDIDTDGFQFYLTTKNYGIKELVANEKLMLQCMSEIIGRQIDVRKVVFVSEFRPNIRMVDTFGVGRVFVAGDAAHIHSPTGGQGLNTSVQDSLNLAWKMSLVCKGLSPPALLDSYTSERLPVVAEMLNITTGYFSKLTGTPSIEGAMKRDECLNMLGVNYRTSSIVLDEYSQPEPVAAYGVLAEGVLVAGDRAPDAPGLVEVGAGTGTRLFDVFGATHHTVLAFVADVASAGDILEALKKYPDGVVRARIVLPQNSEAVASTNIVVDRDGHAYRGYLTEEGEKKVVVVRPDGVVGAMVHGVEGMGIYFSKVLL